MRLYAVIYTWWKLQSMKEFQISKFSSTQQSKNSIFRVNLFCEFFSLSNNQQPFETSSSKQFQPLTGTESFDSESQYSCTTTRKQPLKLKLSSMSTCCFIIRILWQYWADFVLCGKCMVMCISYCSPTELNQSRGTQLHLDQSHAWIWHSIVIG
jgi:hypothetical protein